MCEPFRASKIPHSMKTIFAKSAPAPVGPYAQAVEHGGIVYLSGQVPIDPATGSLVGEGIEEQAEQAFRNLSEVLAAAGLELRHLVRVGVYLVDLAEFPRVNEIYARVMGDARPARSTVQVAALPLGARIEIDGIAVSRSD